MSRVEKRLKKELEELDKNVLKVFLILLNPFAPHLTEELNEKLGYDIILDSNFIFVSLSISSFAFAVCFIEDN